MSLRDHRKKGNKKEFSPSSYDEGGFGFTDLGEGIRNGLMNPLSEKDRKKVEKLQEERKKEEEKKRLERERQKKTSSFGGSKKGGNKMYGRPLRPEDARSIALQEAAEAVVEAKLEGEKSDKYIRAKDAFNKLLGIQRIKSPPRFPIRETLNTAYEVQKLVIEGKINRNVLFLIANTLHKPHLGYTAVAISNVRQTLLDKEVDLVKERITNRADYQNIERLLEVLTANGLKREREYLSKKVPFQVLQKIEARIARGLILEKKPEFADQLPELPLDRKVELTKEYVGKVLGGLQAIGNSSQYSVLTDVVHESWRRPVKLTVPKKEKVEAPLEKEKGTVEEKPAPAVEKKDEKPKDKSAPVVKKVPEKSTKKTVEVKKETPKKSLITDETEIKKIEGLPPLAASALKEKGFNTVGDLKEAPWELIEETPKVGKKSLKILEPLVKVKK